MSSVTSSSQDLERKLAALKASAGSANEMVERFTAEIDFALQLAAAKPEQQAEWQPLIAQALESVQAAIANGAGANEAILAAEKLLAPVGKVAKEYTIHCTGHAHIDMNWLWNWPETVATVNDTFTTVDKLMHEFPTFHFSQSQTSIYQIMKDYLPELHERVKQRIKEGRWEITASQWVEGDKNLASGEILCRHLLYTRRFLKQEYGLPYDTVKIDWEPDTFGHAWTVPSILAKGGVKYYYHHRANNVNRLYWWQGKDGDRVLAFDDRARGYNGQINAANVTKGMLDFEQETGLKDYLFVFGVGDHGGGPTRRDLVMAVKLAEWPIFPDVKLSTNDAFFEAAAKAKDLPVIDREINFVFEGCYTSQSNIKRANRKGENALVEAELAALLGKSLVGMPYPADALYTGWKHTMFNQFHDILPGSGIHATYEHAQGLYQEVLAQTTMVKTRALRAIANAVNTMASCGCTGEQSAEPGAGVGPGIGGGPGEIRGDATISRVGAGGTCCDSFVIFNPNPWGRTEVVSLPLWDREWADEKIAVRDDTGNLIPAQVVNRNPGWGHSCIEVAFPVQDVPGLGYRSYSVMETANAGSVSGCSADGAGRLENEFYIIEVDRNTGAIVQLIDKKTGIDLVPAGGKIGLLEYELEAPHPMTAWVLGQVVKRKALANGASDSPHAGPYLADVRTNLEYGDTKITQTLTIYAGSPRIDINLEVNWLERGDPEIGVPALRANFPIAITDTVATYEAPNGSVQRSTNPREVWSQSDYYFKARYDRQNTKVDLHTGEVPGQKWADLTGKHAGTEEPVGLTLLTDTKYGYQAQGDTLRLTLLRSSYDPDPLPELGKHVIKYAIVPHVGVWSDSDSTRAGYAFNLPLNVVGTAQHGGELPATKGFAEILTPNVMLSGMKKAEDSDALIVRLYEMEGKATTAKLKLDAALAAPNASAVETDVMEQPLAKSTAKMANSVLSIDIPAFSMVTVKIG